MPGLCELERYQIQAQIEQSIQQTSVSYRQQCETVDDQIESWIQQSKYQCTQVTEQACASWPWPFNYICQWVTQLVCGVVLVCVEIVRTVTRVVCQLTIEIVSALLRVVATVSVPIISFACSLGTGSRVALAGNEIPDLSGANFTRTDSPGTESFLWGVATAGQQVEGQTLTSDWQFFVTTDAITARATAIANAGGETVNYESPGRGIDHTGLNVFRADVLRAKALGCNSYRLSIEWSRIQRHRPSWVDDAIQDDTVPQNQIYRFTSSLSSKADALMTKASTENNFDAGEFQLYEQMIQCLLDEGLTPVVTLSHMALPLWVCTPPKQSVNVIGALDSGDANDPDFQTSLRGWESPLTVAAYEAYVLFVVGKLKDKVKFWVTINEPVGSVAEVGYIAGVWPPGFFLDGNRAITAIHLLIAAHVAAYDAIKMIAPSSMVGFSHAVAQAAAAPQTLWNRFWIGDNRAARNQWYYTHVTYFLDAVIDGKYNPEIWRKTVPTIHDNWKGKLDFIAPQYYRRFDIRFDTGQAIIIPFIGGRPITDVASDAEAKTWSLYNDLGWPVAPAGLYDLLKEFNDQYGLPILITENGMGESRDRNRAAYIVSHLQQVLRAIKDAIPVIGYMHWTIADNWEWAYDYLPKARFGLFTIDRTEKPVENGLPSFTRNLTEGALALCYCIRNSQVVSARGIVDDPTDLPARSFGAFTPDGKSVTTPAFGQGSWWSGWAQLDGPQPESEFLMLHIGTLVGGTLFGLVYLSQKDLLFPLTDIAWMPDDNPFSSVLGAGTLVFQHQRDIGASDLVKYSIRLPGRSGIGHQDLKGTRVVQGLSWRIDLGWHPLDGTWASLDPQDEIQSIMPRQYGGAGRRIGAKYLRRSSGWQPRNFSQATQDDGLSVDLGSLQLAGQNLSAQVTQAPGLPSRQWNGVRLPDGIPF